VKFVEELTFILTCSGDAAISMFSLIVYISKDKQLTVQLMRYGMPETM
jgi:hypothetical protein